MKPRKVIVTFELMCTIPSKVLKKKENWLLEIQDPADPTHVFHGISDEIEQVSVNVVK